jgi:hypothetical protein
MHLVAGLWEYLAVASSATGSYILQHDPTVLHGHSADSLLCANVHLDHERYAYLEQITAHFREYAYLIGSGSPSVYY